MRADRLLALLLQLQAHGRLSGRELSRRLEVSERTVHRDMESLSAAGVPVYAVRGAQGGWQLDDDWKTQVPAFDDAELHALLMARNPASGALGNAAERALGKLMAAMPEPMREKAASIRQRLFIDTAGWGGAVENLSLLPVVQEAVTRDLKLRMEYLPADGQRVSRLVDALGLVASGATWYLIANTANGLRSYRVSRIQTAEIVFETIDRPADFDLGEFWRQTKARLEKQWSRCSVLVLMDLPTAQRARAFGAVAEEFTQVVPDPRGWLKLRLEFEEEGHAAFILNGLGSSVEVLEPKSVRQRVISRAKQTLAVYGQ